MANTFTELSWPYELYRLAINCRDFFVKVGYSIHCWLIDCMIMMGPDTRPGNVINFAGLLSNFESLKIVLHIAIDSDNPRYTDLYSARPGNAPYRRENGHRVQRAMPLTAASCSMTTTSQVKHACIQTVANSGVARAFSGPPTRSLKLRKKIKKNWGKIEKI